MDLIELFNKNVNKKTALINIQIIDWYDEPILGFAKVRNVNQWMFFYLVSWDIKTNDKVFVLIPVDLDFINEWKKNKIDYQEMKFLLKIKFTNNCGELFLYKSQNLYSKIFFVKKVKINETVYIDKIEDVVKQKKATLAKWFNYFR